MSIGEKMMTMRDALLERLYDKMHEDQSIFFLSADMGAPLLDKLREVFKDRFINVGIAEQNLVNVATGLALEGFTVYGYAIASFLIRSFEQMRVNLALSSQVRPINVNMIGVGAGVSYDISGPTHHCLEDISVMRTLPNLVVASPSDYVLARKFVDFSLKIKAPKYIRLDGKPLPSIYDDTMAPSYEEGFYELLKGDQVCLVSSGYTTHMALQIASEMNDHRIGVIDVYNLKSLNEATLARLLRNYEVLAILEEAFTGKGGLDSLILNILTPHGNKIVKSFGFKDEYIFKFGSRDFLYRQSNFDKESVKQWIATICKDKGVL